MKIIHLRDKSQFAIQDDLAENIINNISKLKWVKLPSGDLINTVEITRISPVEKKPYYIGFPMTDDLNFVIKQGEKVKFDKAYIRDVEWREEIPEQLQVKMLD
ncbi:MAG: hypothetical protein ACO3UU_00090 [Minisyncoccia bacterium]